MLNTRFGGCFAVRWTSQRNVFWKANGAYNVCPALALIPIVLPKILVWCGITWLRLRHQPRQMVSAGFLSYG